ncbi:class I SAM-dependent methyltransferase [Natranaerobius trueperi]|uniref:SAM-dependent methyltransferase n=1 Tax=Natranaerobius trueperi TaxID=759412 RepID=A0A226BX94_9FIRM|nr:class I SAM-dependent methyltransferase [Natranaerobius trueperi]OWZ82760.1 SAM-dependent methyltransferase [Natranaerobius trueperi]
MSDDKTPVIKRRYDRIAQVYDLFDSPMELMAFQKHRKTVIDQLYGKVLEVGVGTGRNIEYYPDKFSSIEEISAIDFSENMLTKAKEKAEKLHKSVQLYEMDVQEMDFNDNEFDCVFSTCVFCSVPDPIKGLTEIKRVLKPEGRLILLEHVRSKKPLIGTLMDIINPVPVTLWGANINRKTVSNLQKVGFQLELEKNLKLDILKLIIAKNTF